MLLNYFRKDIKWNWYGNQLKQLEAWGNCHQSVLTWNDFTKDREENAKIPKNYLMILLLLRRKFNRFHLFNPKMTHLSKSLPTDNHVNNPPSNQNSQPDPQVQVNPNLKRYSRSTLATQTSTNHYLWTILTHKQHLSWVKS